MNAALWAEYYDEDDYDIDLCQDEYDIKSSQIDSCPYCCSGCMDCLGLSNRDFM